MVEAIRLEGPQYNNNAAELLFQRFFLFSNKKAYVDSTQVDHYYTFDKIELLARNFASNIVAIGLLHQDVISICSLNCIEFPVIFLGIISVGGIVSPTKIDFTNYEVKLQLRNNSSKYLIIQPDRWENTNELLANEGSELPSLKGIIVIDSGKEGGEFKNSERIKTDELKLKGLGFQLLWYSDLIQQGEFPTHRSTKVCRKDVAFLPYTSGTTGLPKGAQISHKSLIYTALSQDVDPSFKTIHTKMILGSNPFVHIAGMCLYIIPSLYLGSTVIAIPRFEAEIFLSAIEEYRIPELITTPSAVLMLATSPLIHKYNLSSLCYITTSSAPLGKELIDRFKENFPNVKLRQLFGMTELMVATLGSFEDKNYCSASVGKPVPFVQAKLLNVDTGKDVKEPHSFGELYIKSKMEMNGYFNNEKATREFMTQDGWLRTGDLAFYDSNGYYYICDRLKELIKHNSTSVAPAEIESVLLAHKDIIDCAVIGIADPLVGEKPTAFVVKAQNSPLTEADVQSFIKEKLSPAKHLTGGVSFVDSIPRNFMGKIMRKEIKENYLQSKMAGAKLA